MYPIIEAPCQDGDEAQGDEYFGNVERTHMLPPALDYTSVLGQSKY